MDHNTPSLERAEGYLGFPPVSLERYMNLSQPPGHSTLQSQDETADLSIDELVHQRTQILNEKLRVLGDSIEARLRLRRLNAERLTYDSLTLTNMLLEFDPNYGRRPEDPQLRQKLYGHHFDLRKEGRQQDVECWRDVVMVARDFLTAWESHEQARARAMFLQADDGGLE